MTIVRPCKLHSTKTPPTTHHGENYPLQIRKSTDDREKLTDGIIRIEYCQTGQMTAEVIDESTKPM